MRPALRGLAAYRDSEPAHAELALALVAELRSVDVLGVETQLHRLAGSVALNGASAPLAQLERVAETVLDSVSLPDRPPADDGDLILSEALARGCAQPVVTAVLCAEVGRRRGVPLGSSATAGGTSSPTASRPCEWCSTAAPTAVFAPPRTSRPTSAGTAPTRSAARCCRPCSALARPG